MFFSSIRKLNNNWKFEYLISFLFIVLGIIGWQFSYVVSSILIISLSVFLIAINNDFKYGIPATIILLFSFRTGFSIDTFPYEIVIPVAIFIIFILVYMVLHFKIKKIKSCIGMLILSISFLIPIFWNNVITTGFEVFYVMYFSWLLYTILYFILCINLNRNSFRITVFTLTCLALLITYELCVTVLNWHFEYPEENIMDFWGYIGWGLCNEAGIVLCFIMPFVFYEIIKSNKMVLSLVSITKLFVLILGIILTTSRGTFLFGGIEFILLSILFLILKCEKKLFKISTLIFGGAIAIVVIAMITKNNFISDIINSVFSMKFDSNGRDSFWESATNIWLSSNRNAIFGSGIVSEIAKLIVFDSYQYTFVVYHSTVIEVMVSAGLIGLIGLGIHFAEKYTQLKGKGLAFILIFGVGYLMVDLYGLIDNTYGMYYYMVPLVITMAAFNNNDNFELFDNKNNELF